MIVCYTEAGPPARWGVLRCPLPSLPAGGSYVGVRPSNVSTEFGLVEEPGRKDRLVLQVQHSRGMKRRGLQRLEIVL